jgi:hypothetical protein
MSCTFSALQLQRLAARMPCYAAVLAARRVIALAWSRSLRPVRRPEPRAIAPSRRGLPSADLALRSILAARSEEKGGVYVTKPVSLNAAKPASEAAPKRSIVFGFVAISPSVML